MFAIPKKKSIYEMNPENQPAVFVPSGSEILFETYDCFENQITNENQKINSIDWNRVNPATGPVFIQEAQPGDILRIDILKIDIGTIGVMAAIPGAGLFGEQIDASSIKIVPIEKNQAVFSNTIRIPIAPMIGVIGVSPRKGSIPCGIPDSHGGNLDNRRIKEGTSLFLQVNRPGALLSIGDLHACMGSGEIMVTGIEVPGEVTAKVTIIKGLKIDNPILMDDQHIYAIASHTDLMEAIKSATGDMQKIIMDKRKIDFNQAGMLLSAAGNVEICQVVDPKLTV